MTLIATTPRTILRALEQRVVQITPLERSAAKFRLERDGDIGGAEIRVFRCLAGPSAVDPTGPFGSGEIGYHFVLRIRVAYGGLTEEEATLLADGDAARLWSHSSLGVWAMPQGTNGVDGVYTANTLIPPPGAEGPVPYGVELRESERGLASYDFNFRIHYLRART